MFMDTRVPIPVVKGKVYIKKVRSFHYVHYEYDRVYNRQKKYAEPKRTTIGKVCDDDPAMMYPNPNYLKFFPDAELPEISESKRSGCLHIGAWVVIDKIMHDYTLKAMLGGTLGEKSDLFLDLCAYTIVSENNAAQYYPDYAYDHPLFTNNMRIYSDSYISEYLHDLTIDDSIAFLNEWNEKRDHREKIYISYDSTNKKCQAGDINFIEVGHSKTGQPDMIFNFSVAYDRTNREPLFYENYPGSITDVSQFHAMIEKAKNFGYKKCGFILDRGYFSEANIHFMDENGYSFIIMVKGMKKLVRQLVLETKGSFEDVFRDAIREYNVAGTTVKAHLFPSDEKDRYFHIYYNGYKAAAEKAEFLEKIDEMQDYMKKHQGDPIVPPAGFDRYFDIVYWHEGQEDQKFMYGVPKDSDIEEDMKLCGYFAIVTSDEMNARDALLLYKSRDDSEKLFRGDKSYLGNRAERVYANESFRSKIFIEFVALIIRSKIYTSLIDEMKELGKAYNFMTVPAAIRELEKIEIIRYGNGPYRLDHSLTRVQKMILKAFDIDNVYMKERINTLSTKLSVLDKQNGETETYN